MRRPQKVLLCEETVSLQGIRQFYRLVEPGAQPEGEKAGVRAASGVAAAAEGDEALQRTLLLKVDALLELLGSVSFHQVGIGGGVDCSL
jgi:hypothetical protein